MNSLPEIKELQDSDKPLILVTNDDGYDSRGITALRAALQPLGWVLVVAPEQDQSGVGRKITINHPLRLRHIDRHRFGVNGTPVDCVRLGLHLLKDIRRPALLVSGINHGPNLGRDTGYSGTIGACLDAQIAGLDGLAVSAGRDGQGGFAIDAAARTAAEQAAKMLDAGPAGGVVWNLNVPYQGTGEVVTAPLDTRGFESRIEQGTDPRGKDYYWIGPYHPKIPTNAPTDMSVFYSGRTTLTPLRPNLTDMTQLVSDSSTQAATPIAAGK
ncbi:5'/3'-nucleotidase SurE [Acanthopleuribacter pedis]|uniref:5'-nucleotidase SurE n=1 Tax=Acanthopleuribacter pedis TaxID=442870 RepID=A0A8J7QAH2_9BACT|nr:5'/3'-nucleotidase SurE [Acanthopleuribacter pedis]MBO1317201.1 5'/3'-nucleotidase SurE [Acanthopleuribacter pedis]